MSCPWADPDSEVSNSNTELPTEDVDAGPATPDPEEVSNILFKPSPTCCVYYTTYTIQELHYCEFTYLCPLILS